MKQIKVYHTDGVETVLPSAPNLSDIQAIVGGYFEHVRVLDRVKDNRLIFTSMYINEGGLRLQLQRNEKATEIYQRNVRTQFPDCEQPFLKAAEEFKKRFPGATFISAGPAGYEADPFVVGNAIVFEGYTVEEVSELYESMPIGSEHGSKSVLEFKRLELVKMGKSS